MSEPVIAEQAPRDGWRHLLTMLMVFAVGFLAQPGPAAAQVQTYSYNGPPWNIAYCGGAPPCINGSLSASVTLSGVTAGYSGSANTSQVLSFSLGGGGVGTTTTISGSFGFGANSRNGQITDWSMAANDGTVTGGTDSTSHDQATLIQGGLITKAGAVAYPPVGATRAT